MEWSVGGGRIATQPAAGNIIAFASESRFGRVHCTHNRMQAEQGLTTVTALCLYLLLPDRDRWRWMRVPYYHYHHGERAKIPWARQGKLATPPVPVLQGKGNGRQAGDRLQAVVGLGKAAGAAGSTASIVYFLRQLSQPVNTTG